MQWYRRVITILGAEVSKLDLIVDPKREIMEDLDLLVVVEGV